MSGKTVIPFVPAGDTHNSAGSIACQYIFGQPNWNFSVGINGMNGIGSCENATDFLLRHSFPFAPAFYPGNIFLHGLCLLGACQLSGKFVFRRQDHKIHAKERIRSSGVHPNLMSCVRDSKVNLCTTGFSNPVGLHLLHGITKCYFVQAFQQAIGISSNTQVPLAQFFLDHRMASTFTYAIDHFVVSQHRS